MDLDPAAVAEQEHVVTAADTALAVGSGDLEVLGTPRLLAWCEGATVAALVGSLRPGETSVGVRVGLDHLAPSPVGATVTVRARVVAHDGRRVTLEVGATASDGTVLAAGTVERVVVDAARFTARLAR